MTYKDFLNWSQQMIGEAVTAELKKENAGHNSAYLYPTFCEIERERVRQITADTTGNEFIYQMFVTELDNHEYRYSLDVISTLRDLSISNDMVSENQNLKHGLHKAEEELMKGVEY